MSAALEIGTQLVKLCQEGKGDDAIEQFYSDSIVSLEGPGGEPSIARMEGIDAVKGKNEWWFANHEIHSMEAEGPYVGHREDQFVVRFKMDVTPKEGDRMQMTEVGVYTVADGKVQQEEFLYLMA